MKLNDILSGQLNTAEWEAKGYQLPKFDIKAVREKTPREDSQRTYMGTLRWWQHLPCLPCSYPQRCPEHR